MRSRLAVRLKPSPPPVVDTWENPFKAASAHHRPMGTGAQYAGDGHPTNTSWQLENFTNLNVNNGFGVNIYKNAVTDPLRTVGKRQGGSGIGLPWTGRTPFMRNPDSGAEASDNMICMLDYDTGLVHEFYGWQWNSGSPLAYGLRTYSVLDKGHGASKVGFSASGVAMFFGLVRGHELASGDPIQHVSQCALRIREPNIEMANAFQWPAINTDGACNGIDVCTGNIKYGSLMALNQRTYTDTYINTLGLSNLGVRIAKQMRDYGMYVIDGTGGKISRADQFVTVKAEYIAQMKIIVPLMRYVTNNAENQAASGGGTPIALNSAYDA